MEDLFKLYCKLQTYKEISPEIMRQEMDKLKNVNNFFILEILYSFFMLGYNKSV